MWNKNKFTVSYGFPHLLSLWIALISRSPQILWSFVADLFDGVSKSLLNFSCEIPYNNVSLRVGIHIFLEPCIHAQVWDSHTTKNIVFTYEDRNITAYIGLQHSHHVGKHGKKNKFRTTKTLFGSMCFTCFLKLLVSLLFSVLIKSYLTTEYSNL